LDVVTGLPGRAGYTAFGAATIAESAVRYAQESKLISQKEATMIGNDVEAYFAGGNPSSFPFPDQLQHPIDEGQRMYGIYSQTTSLIFQIAPSK